MILILIPRLLKSNKYSLHLPAISLSYSVGEIPLIWLLSFFSSYLEIFCYEIHAGAPACTDDEKILTRSPMLTSEKVKHDY